MKNKKLVIVGAGEFAQIAYEYFTYDSEYKVVSFAVERKFITDDLLFGLPIIAFEDLEELYTKDEYYIFVALSYVKLNRERTRLYNICDKAGYSFASYISSKAFVWHNVEIGNNTFIFEDNTLQYNAKIGNNVVLWSGNHVGHRTIIKDNCWVTSHVVISGYCTIEKNSFIGVNATIGDEVQLGEDTVFGAGAVTVKSLPDKGGVYVGNPARKLVKTAYTQFGLDEDSAL